MRLAVLILGLMAVGSAGAQEARKKAPAKKQAVHAKPTPEQIRRFNELEKRQKK